MDNLGMSELNTIDNIEGNRDAEKHIDQGIEFLNYSRKNNSTQNDLLQESSAPEWSSIVEAMGSRGSTSSQTNYLRYEINTLEKTFHIKITEYSILTKSYIELLRKKPLSSADKATILEKREILKSKYNEIKEIATKIKDDIDSLSTNGKDMNKNISDLQIRLHKQMYNLDLTKRKIDNVQNIDNNSLDGSVETTTLNVTSIYYFYVVWIILAITVLGFTVNAIINPNASIINAAIVVGSLGGVYLIAKWYGS